ncbi:hypothetical protein DD237_007267 [Peronospora effusa]|uniref:Uncharacterized protein n=1 Tax=Peronospora effusa TaxID=542832 RepID=A0A3R7WQ91_9STRA|nr:hypothetical protein DD237_007267 [Peronospora effusa]
MSKLLTWNDALFLVRWERGKLQIQRVDVDIKRKTISLHLCTVNSNNETTGLPVDARLVAANEVEDSILAIRYPVLVFLSIQEARQSLSASDERRRSIENYDAVVANNNAVLSPTSWLVVCILYQQEGIDEMQLRFLKMLEVPTRFGDEDASVDEKNANMLQVFVMDGPHVVLFERRSQHMTLLKLQRAMQGNESLEFRQALDVAHDMKDDAPETNLEVISCTYVSELYSTRPHILIHMLRSSSSSSDRHTWSVVDLEDDRGSIVSNKKALLCHYLPVFSSAARCIGPMSKLEQITCCCFILEKSQRDFIASPFCDTDAFVSWDLGSSPQSTQTSIGVSTLVVTGTTSNTIYVHANGILLVSYVLPTRPAEIWSLCENRSDQRHVLCVRCDDDNRSFFMLEFSSNVQHVSMGLLLCKFLGIGLCVLQKQFLELTPAWYDFRHAHNVNFAGTHASDSLTQVLLLNNVRGIFGIYDSTYTVGNRSDAYKSLDHKQLVKRSVLISQKSSSPETKLSCHRLRRHEEKNMKDGSRFRKRSRNNEDVRFGDIKAEPFCYIERTHKASSRDKSVNHLEVIEDGAANDLAASHVQLGKLAGSLFARLSNGLQELERLQVIVSDKVALAHQLNQLIVQLWQKLQAKARNPSMKHLFLQTFGGSAQEVDIPYFGSQGRAEMETIVTATTVRNDAKDGPNKQDSGSDLNNLKLEQQVSLKRLTLLEYAPSSSLVHAEVVLTNMSDFAIDDSYVFLTAPKGGQTVTQGWRCLSSVASEFSLARGMTENQTTQQQEARFQLDFQFDTSYIFLPEQKPLEVMLWLHWGPSQDAFISNTTLAWHPSESALAIASVKIYPENLIGIGGRLQTTVESSWSDQKQLLFISSGSNLVSWSEQTCTGIPASIDSVIRPTFALISINVRSREWMLHELRRFAADLPSDVYVMHNPFQHTHLGVLRRMLCSMRREILTIRRHQGSQDKEDEMDKEHGAEDKHTASTHRAMQCDTDLRANWLLQRLQERVNFHLMLFNACPNKV